MLRIPFKYPVMCMHHGYNVAMNENDLQVIRHNVFYAFCYGLVSKCCALVNGLFEEGTMVWNNTSYTWAQEYTFDEYANPRDQPTINDNLCQEKNREATRW